MTIGRTAVSGSDWMTSQDRDHTSGRAIRPSFTPNGQTGNLIDVTEYARLCNNKRWRFWSLGRHKLLSSPSVYLPEKCINLAKVLTSNDTQSIQSTLSRARATQNFVGFAKQSVNRKAFLVQTIFFSPTKHFNNCHQKLFREHDQRCPRCEQGCKNEKLVTTKIFKSFANAKLYFSS